LVDCFLQRLSVCSIVDNLPANFPADLAIVLLPLRGLHRLLLRDLQLLLQFRDLTLVLLEQGSIVQYLR
jgi:hypothetical protein